MSGTAAGFVDVRFTRDGFSLPRLKWRELLFIGALRAEEDREVGTTAETRRGRLERVPSGVAETGETGRSCRVSEAGMTAEARPAEIGRYVRDPSRPMPPFAAGDIFPVGASFLATVRGEWVEISVSAAPSGSPGEQEA